MILFEPRVICLSSVMTSILFPKPPFVVLPRGLQPLLDQIDIRLRRRDTALSLLLKRMQHVDHLPELHHVSGSIGVPIVILNYLEHARTKSCQWLGRGMLAAKLRDT